MKTSKARLEQINIRGMEAVDAYMYTSGRANWSEFTLKKAVKEGYVGWVYKAINVIAKSVSSVPWIVRDVNNDNEIVEHYIADVLNRPNVEYSKQDLFELIVAWYQLTGVAYLKKIMVGSKTQELWPISPDRISPISSKDPGQLIAGYSIIDDGGAIITNSVEFNTDNIIYFRLLDPANPIGGIGPLRAAAKSVDIDNEQQEWNKAAMENRGIFDGVFTFKSALSMDQADGILAKIKERFSGGVNARTPLIVGADAKYTRMSVTPAEIDFLKSRSANKEEIFSIFGIPIALVSSESMTYNNYKESLRMLWELTNIPLLDDLSDKLNMSFYDELDSGRYRIDYDLSGISAVKDNENDRADAMTKYWKMGVPFSVLSEKYKLGIEEFDNWDKSWTGGAPSGIAAPTEEDSKKKDSRYWKLIPIENRSSAEQDQILRDEMSEGRLLELYSSLLTEQKESVFSELDKGDDGDPIGSIDMDSWIDPMTEASNEIAIIMASTVVVDERGNSPKFENRNEFDDELAETIKAYMEEDDWIEKEAEYIGDFTKENIEAIIKDAIVNDLTVQQIKDAIQDMGIFSPERSLRLARTLAGTASSIGQLSAGEVSGATEKVWVNSGFEVRDSHVARGGEVVPIDDKFSSQGCGKPKYPLDPILCPADRVNCRCSLTFR